MIKRSTPDVGYLDAKMLLDFGTVQTVRVKDTVYFSGICAIQGTESVYVGDFPGQIRFVIRVLGDCLRAEGLTFANVVMTRIYSPALPELYTHASIITEAFREHPPASTWIGVRTLARPEFLIELEAVAATD